MTNFAYFRNLRTFQIITGAKIVSYDLELSPYGKKVSTIYVTGRVELQEETVVQIDDRYFILSSCTPNETDKTTAISMKPFFNIFDRAIPFVQQSSITAQIEADIGTYFKNCTDPLFALPWISVSASATALPYVKPNVDDTGRYNLYDYLMQVIESVYVLVNSATAGVTLIPIRRWFLEDGTPPEEANTYEQVLIYDCSTTKDVLVSATFSQDLISKITHYDPETEISTDYYLLDDGTVTTDVNSTHRVEGRWIIYSAANVNVGLVSAQFARSRYSHNIEILVKLQESNNAIVNTRQDPKYYAKCTIKLPSGTIIKTRITSINRRSSENGVVRLTAGRTLTTLNEIIQEVRNNARN